jgi:hypothetical protein
VREIQGGYEVADRGDVVRLTRVEHVLDPGAGVSRTPAGAEPPSHPSVETPPSAPIETKSRTPRSRPAKPGAAGSTQRTPPRRRKSAPSAPAGTNEADAKSASYQTEGIHRQPQSFAPHQEHDVNTDPPDAVQSPVFSPLEPSTEIEVLDAVRPAETQSAGEPDTPDLFGSPDPDAEPPAPRKRGTRSTGAKPRSKKSAGP